MSKTCKKLLSFTLAVMVLVSTLASALVFKAAETVGTFTVGTKEIDLGADTAELDLTIAFREAIKSPHDMFTLTAPEGFTLENVVVKSQVITNDLTADPENGVEGKVNIKYTEGGTNFAAGKVIIESPVDEQAPMVTEVVLTATYAVADTVVAGEYEIAVASSLADWYEGVERDLALEDIAGSIVVAEPCEADTSKWITDADNHWHACVTEGCDVVFDKAAHEFDEGVVTKEAEVGVAGEMTYTCEICDYAKTEEIPALEAPECDHADATAVVTTKPTKDAVGTRTYTCECGHTWTEDIAVASKIETGFGHDISLESSIAVGFTFKKADTNVDNAVDIYGYAVKNVYSGNTVLEPVYQYFVKEDFTDRVGGSTPRKVVKYTGTSAKDMSNDIYIIIYFENADGSFTYIEETYRLTNYIDAMLPYYDPTASESNRKFVTLLMDMVKYGEAAQTQFNYNTANLPTAAYGDYLQYASADITEYNTAAKDTPLDGATHKLTITLEAGSTISILSAVRLADNTKLTSTDALAGYYAECVYNDGASTKRINAEDFIVDGGEVKIRFSEFATKESTKVVNITLYDANGNAVSNTRTYSIESYCAGISGYYDVGTNIRTLADNLLKFCQSAAIYFAS